MNKISNYFISAYKGYSARTWIVVFSTFVNSLGTSIVVFLALYLSNILNMSVERVGFVISTFGIGIFLGAYLGGFLCDRLDYYKVSIATLLASGAMVSLIPFLSNFMILTVLVIFNGLFYGAFKPANALNLFADGSPSDRARVNGLYRVAMNLGMGAASLIGGVLASIYFPLVFWFDGVTSLLAAGILFYYYHPTIHNKKHTVKNDKKIIFDKVFIALCLLLLINCIVFFQIRSAYPLYLNQYYHISASVYGYLFLLNCIMVVFFEVPILNAVKSSHQIAVATIGSMLICFSMFILPFGNSLLWAVTSFVLLTLGEIFLFSTMLILMIDRSNENNKGKYIGIYQSMFGVASMVAPILGNYVYSLQSSLLWYICGLIGLACMIIFYLANLVAAKDKPIAIFSVKS
jgi:MFS family permease